MDKLLMTVYHAILQKRELLVELNVFVIMGIMVIRLILYAILVIILGNIYSKITCN